MSTCISRAGEYSAHETEPGNYICDRCGVLDEDGIFAERDALRAEVGRLNDEVSRLNAEVLRTESAAIQALDAIVASVRAALAKHPRACAKHPDDDVVKCGWKSVVLDVQRVLDDPRDAA
jgi:hypothetical protein